MYKILSLDGGGSWAVLQLLTLKERFKNDFPELHGHDILKQFDMVIANSGGSIVLAALAENYTIDEALALFDKASNRRKIFSENSFKETYWPVFLTKSVIGPKYSTKRKGEAFKELFPKIDGVLMKELPAHIGKESLKLIVSTFDAYNNRAKFFRSYSDLEGQPEYVRLTQAINGSSNAPVNYFDFPARFKAKPTDVFYELWDGALGGFNNPVAAGVIEAFYSGVDKKDMQVVSIGNGNKLMSIAQKKEFYKLRQITTRERAQKWKFWRYKFQMKYFTQTVTNQAKTILYNPPDWANFVAYSFLLRNNNDDIQDRFIRMSPLIHLDENFDAETKELVQRLYDLDMDLTRDEDIQALKDCFTFWKQDKIWNQPIRYSLSRENELKYNIGDQKFSNALRKW